MPVIDFILNLAALLLWVNWRAFGSDPLGKGPPATLAGTLKRTDSRRLKRWHILAALGTLLAGRALLYRQLEAATEWIPKMDLTVVVLVFRLNSIGMALLLSLVSFARCLVMFNFWLLTLEIINRGAGDEQPLQRLIHQQLGWLARLPTVLQLGVMLVAVPLLWGVIHPLLAYANVMAPVQSASHLLGQGLLLTASLITTLKYVLPVFLLLHLMLTYVYLGRNVLWDYVTTTARNILGPLNRLGLRTARVDFAPLLGAVLTLLLLDALPRWILRRVQSGGSIWPQ